MIMSLNFNNFRIASFLAMTRNARVARCCEAPVFEIKQSEITKYKTSFPPHFSNKTTSVAMNGFNTSQPYYLIQKCKKNEVMRLNRICLIFRLLRLFCLKNEVKNEVENEVFLCTRHWQERSNPAPLPCGEGLGER